MSEINIKVGDRIKAPQNIQAYVTQDDPAINVVRNHPELCTIQSIWDNKSKATLVVGGHCVAVYVKHL